MTYDAVQMLAVLMACTRCHRAFYMTHPQPVCIACRKKG